MAKKKKMTKRNKSYVSIETNVDEIKFKLKLLDMDDLADRIFVNVNDFDYLLIEKLLTFADVPTYAKYPYSSEEKKGKDAFSDEKIIERIEKNILFYNSRQDMFKFEKSNKKTKKFFLQTKQGNIYLPLEFYQFLDMKDPKEYDYVKHAPRFIFDENHYDVYLVRKSLDEYFSCDKTNECLKKLGKPNNFSKDWKSDDLSNKDYQRIELSIGVHGIGSKRDEVFHTLRGIIFARDKMIVVCRKRKDSTGKYEIYIMFFRNPKFYQLMGIGVKAYSKLFFKDDMDAKDEENRNGQAKWRDMLAEFDVSEEDSDVIICPISGLEVEHPKEATILRASHIKEYSKCKNNNGKINVEEAYDINNGLLISADADALFDKHMITINPNNGDIIYSKLISKDLIKQLKFNEKIDNRYLSTERIKYLNIHFDRFNELEKNR